MKSIGQLRIYDLKMAKLKLTKGELKKQRDALKQYQRYLPTLQLKKQQLQMEILRQLVILEEREHNLTQKQKIMFNWVGLFAAYPGIEINKLIKIVKINTSLKNIAGVDLPIFESTNFEVSEYDLFLMPFWLDAALEQLKIILSLGKEIAVIKNGLQILRQELRITTQRVNLFEKVKIPVTLEAIRLIKIYIGDQMANAVGRSKIAKRKIELAIF